MTTFTDQSPMPFGKYKGKSMVSVPADYLLWLHDNHKVNGAIKQYITDNLQVLKGETKFARR
jgi:uncharacterized protein (DUF3820 family)